MDKEEFVDALKIAVVNDSIKAVESNLLKPAGRQPQKKILELSEWFNNLKPEDKSMVKKVITESVDTSVFSFLCVLDGVSAIEGLGEKGVLKLYYEKGHESILLNDLNKDYLHDLL